MQRGAKIAPLDADQHTPLHIATAANAHDVVQLLLEADIEQITRTREANSSSLALQNVYLAQESGTRITRMVNLVNIKKLTAPHLAAFFRSEVGLQTSEPVNTLLRRIISTTKNDQRHHIRLYVKDEL